MLTLVMLCLAPAARAVDLDRLERDTHAAFESADPGAFERFESLFKKLTQAYEREHRSQELAWTYAAYGYEAEARAIERNLIAEMGGDEPSDLRRLTDVSARVFLATYPSGLRAVLVGTDHRVHGEPEDPRADERRYAVITYEISQAAGWNIVPAATFATISTPAGPLRFLARALLPQVRFPDHGHESAPYRDEILHALDFLTEQVDRNKTGFGYRPGGRVVAFDNRRALDFMDRAGLGDVYHLPSMHPPAAISAELREGLRRLAKALDAGSGKQFSLLRYAESVRLRRHLATLLALPTADSSCDTMMST